MEVLNSPRRLLHPIMEENFNSAGELSEDDTFSNCSEYSENLFLSEDSLEMSDNEHEFTRGKRASCELDRSSLSEYFISSLTQDANFKKDSISLRRGPLFTDKSSLISTQPQLQCDSSFDSGDFSCDSLNISRDSSEAKEETVTSEDVLDFRSKNETPENTVKLVNRVDTVKLNASVVNTCLDDRTNSNNNTADLTISAESNFSISDISGDISEQLGDVNGNFFPSEVRERVSNIEKLDSSLVSLDSLEKSFAERDVKINNNNACNLSTDSANWSFDGSQRYDVIDTSSDGGFFESLNRSFNEMNENIQSIKQLSVKKFEDTLALRGYVENCESFHALLEKYVSLKNRAEGIQTEIKLKAEMAQLKDDIIALAENVLSSGTDKIDRNELEKYINQMKKELESLQERKLKLTLVNLKVHQFKTESGVPVDDLKAEVAKLYQIWDYNYNRVSSQLESLQRVSNIWKQFEAHRNEFLSVLGDDEKTIQLLDTALQDGDISPDIATSVRVVAKVLSEKHDDNSPPDSLTETLSGATSLLDPCSGEGSLSDSGISDSGSEQDICEREKRLGEIRKLAKEMDLLSPGSLFAMDVNKRVQEMEAKLRELQRNCRNLIVKTAVCAETGCPAAPKKPFLLTPTKRCRSPLVKEGLLATADDGDDGNKPSQFWRILKCSMPFHLAIMLLVCVACLLEPHCCDSLNNFQRSIAPQMRYLYGPPPI